MAITDTRTPASSALAGIWEVDPGHSTLEFRVRHAGVARVRGTFERFEGRLEIADGAVTVRGELTIRGVTREIVLEGEVVGRGHDDEGAERVGLELTGRLDRRDYGLTWNAAIDGGGVLVGNRVDVAVEISAVRVAPEA